MAEPVSNYGPFGWSIGGSLDAHAEGLVTKSARERRRFYFNQS